MFQNHLAQLAILLFYIFNDQIYSSCKPMVSLLILIEGIAIHIPRKVWLVPNKGPRLTPKIHKQNDENYSQF